MYFIVLGMQKGKRAKVSLSELSGVDPSTLFGVLSASTIPSVAFDEKAGQVMLGSNLPTRCSPVPTGCADRTAFLSMF
jgi:hypothetical protein